MLRPSSSRNSQVFCKVNTSKATEFLATLEPVRKQSRSSDTDEGQDDEIQEVLPEAEVRLLVTYYKHKVMVSLMHEIYVIFDKRWSVESKSRAGLEASGSSTPACQ